MKEFENTYEFWEKAQIGDTLKAGIIKKSLVLFQKVYACKDCNKAQTEKGTIPFLTLVTQLSDNKFKCEKCGKEYTRKELGINQNNFRKLAY